MANAIVKLCGNVNVMGIGNIDELSTGHEDSEKNNKDIAFNSMRVGSIKQQKK